MSGLCECGCGKRTPIARQSDTKRGYVKGQPHRFVPGHQANPNFHKGHPSLTRTHGQSRTAEHRAYFNAKDRCTNFSHPQFLEYGARGIEFRFTSFEQFFAELGPRPRGMSVDRINNDRHYEPGNVRWATRKLQQQNTRQSKLTEEDMQEIKRRREAGESGRSLAKAFGVSEPNIVRITKHRTEGNERRSSSGFSLI